MTDEPTYFVPVPEWVVLARLTPQALALYTVLLAHVNRERGDGQAWPSMDLLADLLGFGKRQSVIRYLNELAARGIIVVDTEACATGRRNRYTVHTVPPGGYVGLTSMTEFHRVRREVRGGLSPTGDYGSSATEDNRSSPAGDKNQTKPIRRSDPYESTSGDEVASSGPRTSSPTRMTIFLPADFDALPDGSIAQQLITSTVGAARKAGFELTEEAKSHLGRSLKHHVEVDRTDRRELVRMLEVTLKDASKGIGDWSWMFGYPRAA